jgi:N-acetylglucosamine-6-phosphate deacetylase
VGGSRAGSTISAAAGLRWSVREAGIALADATAMAASTPSRLAGHRERGRIERGRRADLLLLDEELRPRRVLACGDWAAR